MRRTENGWQVRFNSELVDSYDTYAEANAARWEVFEKSGWEVTQSIRDIISGMESTSAIGREYVYRLKDDEMTMGRAVQENIASASQLRHRAQIADRNLSAVDAAFDEAALTTEALSADLSDAEAARRILGSSRTEFKDGVYQTTITLYKGASELTVLEEKIEGDARLMLEDGRKGWMISALRDVEDKTGVTLFRKVADDGQLSNQDVVEAWSSLGVSYFTATSRKGEASTQGGVRPKGLDGVGTRQFFSRAMRTKMGAVLSAYGTFFREVWKQAAALNKVRREGALDAELESTLRQQLGLGDRSDVNGTIYSRAGETEVTVEGDVSFSSLHPNVFQPLKFAVKNYLSYLDKWKRGEPLSRELISMGPTPPVLQAAGANELGFMVPASLFDKVTKDRHSVPVSVLENLPQLMADPVAVFPSRTRPDSFVVLTDAMESGKGFVVAAIHLDRQVGRDLMVNQIQSLYGRSPQDIAAMFSESPIYESRQKSLAMARRVGLQLPKRGTPPQGYSRILDPQDIVNFVAQKRQANSAQIVQPNTDNPSGDKSNTTITDTGTTLSLLDSNNTGGINENREETTQIHHRSGRNAQSLAQSAARFAGGSNQVYFGPEQSASYPERREAQVKLLANEPEAPAQSGEPTFVGGEHKVYIPNMDQPTVVIKHTLPGEFGRVMDEKSILNPRTMQMERKLTLRPALPSEYARRWAVVSDVFGLDVEIQGRVSGTKDQLSIVQPFITQDIDDPATTADVTGFMEANGFTKVDPKLIAIPEVADVTWYRQRDGVLVTDAHPRNFRLTLNSEVVPIDFIITTVPKGTSKLLDDPTSPWVLSELAQHKEQSQINKKHRVNSRG